MPLVSDVTDADLVTRAAGGDRGAFDALFERHADTVHDHVARWSRDAMLAADATQEAFVALLGHLDTIRDGQAVLAWLLRTARNRAIDQLRRTAREAVTSPIPDGRIPSVLLTATDPDRAVSPEAAAVTHELAALVWDVAAGLDERTFTVLDLSVRQGLDGPAIAAVMDTTPENANVLVHRMRQRMGTLVGAVLLLRDPATDCAELTALRDAAPTPVDLAAARGIEAHAEACARCGPRRDRAVAPLPTYAALAQIRAPIAVRTTIDAAAAEHFGMPSGPGRGPLVRRAAVGALVVGLVLVAGGVANGLRTAEPEPTGPEAALAEPLPGPTAAPSPSPSPDAPTLDTLPRPEPSPTPEPPPTPEPSPSPTATEQPSPDPSPTPTPTPAPTPVAVTIDAPAAGTAAPADRVDDQNREVATLDVAATVTGPEGAQLQVTWVTDLAPDVVLLEGAAGSLQLWLSDACKDTTHPLRATATDPDTGETATTTVEVVAQETCSAPLTLTIERPGDGSRATADGQDAQGRQIARVAAAATAGDGETIAWTWTSDQQPDEVLLRSADGTLELVNESCDEPVIHRITVEAVREEDGASVTETVEVTVDPPICIG